MSAGILRTYALALVYFTVAYYATVWLDSVRVSKIDVQLNNIMRLNTGTIKSTQLQWLPSELVNCRRHAWSLLYEQMTDIPVLYGGWISIH
jgi:hypothetical protein